MATPSHVELVDLFPVRYAYLRHLGPYGPALHDFWSERAGPWMAHHGWLGREHYGLTHDDPDVTRPEDCRYDAAVALADGEHPAEATGTLPGGRYAVLPFHGPSYAVGAAWDRLLRDWLPASGLRRDDDRPCFERYPAEGALDPATGFVRCDLCLSVASA